MTWGQLRMQLQTAAPGVSLDLIDEYLTSRYEQVLEATDWQGLQYFCTIESQAAYQSGADTVTATLGSNSVTGAGTAWTAALLGNTPVFYLPGDTVTYTATYVSANQLTLDRTYEGNGVDAVGTVYSARAYVFMQNVYPLPSDARSITSILDPVTGWPLGLMSKDALDASAGQRTQVGRPAYYAPYGDTPENAPPVIHEIELFPPPQYARGYRVEYVHAAAAFDGGNTSGSPLPWVSNAVLLYGARADIATYLEKLNQATFYEAKFTKELDRLLLLEHAQKRVKRPLQMAARFTRHRGIRATRALNRGWGPGQGGPN